MDQHTNRSRQSFYSNDSRHGCHSTRGRQRDIRCLCSSGGAIQAGIDADFLGTYSPGRAKSAELKKIANKYDAFMASDTLIKRVPRLLPGLNRKGKFPTRVPSADDPADYVDEVRCTIKYAMKKVLCMNLAVGNVNMTEDELSRNIQLSINFLISLLKRGWQNIKVLYLKSTMGPVFPIYF